MRKYGTESGKNLLYITQADLKRAPRNFPELARQLLPRHAKETALPAAHPNVESCGWLRTARRNGGRGHGGAGEDTC